MMILPAVLLLIATFISTEANFYRRFNLLKSKNPVVGLAKRLYAPRVSRLQQVADNLSSELGIYARRLPGASVDAGKAAFRSFVMNAAFMVPFGVLFGPTGGGFGSLDHLERGFKFGIDMSKYGAAFAGGEALLAGLRNKRDVWNRCFGSGMATALLNVKKSPSQMAMGFCSGFGLVYAVDTYVLPNILRKPVMHPATKFESPLLSADSNDGFGPPMGVFMRIKN